MASYVTRPNAPTGPEYCRVLPTCTPPTTGRPETIHRLISRYNHNRSDWERANQVAVTPAVACPAGAIQGDLFVADTDWGIASQANCALWLAMHDTANRTNVGLWQANMENTGFVLLRPRKEV